MGWPWRFVDLDEEARALRRETLDRYAAYSQLSVLIPVLGFVGFQLARRAYRYVSASTFGRSAAYSSLPAAPNSPSIKSRRLTPSGALEIRLGAVKWWLGDEVFFLGKYRGERDVWVFGGLWTAWLLLLCMLGTDGDYLHLTKRFGVVAAAQFPIQYLLALKFLNPFALAFRVSHEQINRWHRLQGRVVYILLLLHVICYVNYFIQVGILVRRLFAPVVFAGVVSWIGINLMTATAIDLVRNFSYRLFFIVHLLVSFALPPLLFYHAKPARVSMVAALAFIILDIVVRRLKTITTKAAFERIPGTNLIKVSAPLPQRSQADEFNNHPGSHVYVSIPAAARPDAGPTSSSWIYDFCLNPFTVADVDEATGDLTIVARHRGGPMTAALAHFAKGSQSLPPTPTTPNLDAASRSAGYKIPLSIEGPYGAAQHFPNLAGPDFDRVLMVTGGVGATFLIPLFRALLHENPNAKVELIWAVRSPDEASWAVQEGSGGNILTDDRVHLFMTGDVVADDPGSTPAGGSSLAPSGSSNSTSDRAASGTAVEMNPLYRDGRGGRFSAMSNRRRPDLRKIVDDIFKHGSEERVAVLVCGPEEMARELRGYVGAWVQRGRSVWWHNEGFGCMSQTTQDQILVLGAGELGDAMLDALTSSPLYSPSLHRISVLIRPETITSTDAAKQARVRAYKAKDISLVGGDLVGAAEADLVSILAPYTTVILASGMTAPPGTQLKICRAALAARAARFVPWQFGVDYDVLGPLAGGGLFAEACEVRSVLRAQDAVRWTVVSCGIFTSFLFEESWGVVVPQGEGVKVTALGSWEDGITATTAEDIARVTARLVLDPEEDGAWSGGGREGAGPPVYIAGDTLTYADLADLVGRVTGKEVVRECVGRDDLRKTLKQDPDNKLYKYRVVFGGGSGRHHPYYAMTRPTNLRIARTPLAGLTIGNAWSSCINSSRPTASLTLFNSRRNASSTAPAASAVTTSADHSMDPIQARRSLIVNPPATTRPPPLNLPTRGADTSKIGHLIATGKAYFTFYKTGMSHIGKNYKLSSAVEKHAQQVREVGPAATEFAASDPSSSDPIPPPPGSRAAVILRERLRHDLSRLPVFALILLVCGEFTPLVVMLLPRVVPLPCRIPRQVDKLDRLAEAGRSASFAELKQQQDGNEKSPLDTAVVYRHIGRSLSLLGGPVSTAMLPSPILQRRVNMRLAFLADDDAVLRANGATAALVPDEVRLACKDRGMDVLGVDDGELERLLTRWLDLLAGCDRETTFSRMRHLLVTRPQDWPRSF
ncbi:hypothetical protein PpBr36_08216 [Pyricularia pennisetigena]|uniref:hypothetical protein n=1 Tax=Pyricularia pennisetigena TaxID=1578925 RepID=UPI001153A7DE|nr:hypothetical protein PpBr36_08216 [Pyricularia pennisetigena]TLS24427.1 hypothetical protein PpBr36_08216 [Pyricularia pennisetigena]